MKTIKNLLNDKTLVKWGLFCAATAALLYILYFLIKNFGNILGVVASAVSSLCSALTPLFIGIVIAYLLCPVVELIDRKILARAFFKKPDNPVKYNRLKKIRFLLSIILTFLLIFAIICAITYAFTVLIIGQFVFNGLSQMFDNIMEYFKGYETAVREWAASLPNYELSDEINKVVNSIVIWFSNNFALTSVVGFIAKTSGSIINFVIGVIISIYLIQDKEFFLGLCGKASRLLLPGKASAALNDTINEINKVFAQFIRGALLDALIIAILTSVTLSILGLRFAVFIGCFAGIANIIPYFGPLIGMVPAFIVGAFTGGLSQGIIAVLLMLIIQQFDANLIYPKIVGATIGLHPLFVLLAITVAGYYGGIVGMIVAVPIAGVLKVFILKYVHYLENRNGNAGG